MYEEKIVPIKKHIRRNRAKYAAGATLVACLTVQYKIGQQWNHFLRDHEMLDTFYREED
ncbi:hypothetical protein HWD32_gp39 [Gordonia phage Secretariat]|uniref:Uncharacterized protein n=1 Tax=Gordonia phage Secretariat TaxID=2725616 RepID=A0A6M3SUS6_9CAUD|nr:hypothetical protein HWD32_gp39 [Gordonia phage Secretariat]QJD49616.1 hypothetical protein SEA_SECRETARIAT_39 [Gordonia phage Secretariat]